MVVLCVEDQRQKEDGSGGNVVRERNEKRSQKERRERRRRAGDSNGATFYTIATRAGGFRAGGHEGCQSNSIGPEQTKVARKEREQAFLVIRQGRIRRETRDKETKTGKEREKSRKGAESRKRKKDGKGKGPKGEFERVGNKR
jgi:hypothetical protein